MEIRLLGSLEIIDESGDRVVLHGVRPQMVLAALALQPEHTVSADRLVDALWGDAPPAGAANALQRHVSTLRRLLGSASIARRGRGYALSVEELLVDVRAYEELDRLGREEIAMGDLRRARTIFAEALQVWRGDALTDLAGAEYFQPEATRLNEARLATLEARIDTDLALGEHASLVAELEGLTGRFPLREHLWAQLMLALARAGRQGDALRTYQAARAVLVEELGLEPSDELRSLEKLILNQNEQVASRRASGAGRRRSNVAAPITGIIGRDAEIKELRRMLEQRRLVTITGTGGAGKTHLALEVARDWFATTEEDVWLVELAGVRDSDGVLPAIASVLQLSEASDRASIARITQFLARSPALLVVDNCEHLVESAATLARDLLGACPSLRILATSREPLALNGEAVFPLAALRLDDAVALFAERARAVNPNLGPDGRFTPDDTKIVEQLCRDLDRLPLAIELAAARVRTVHLQVLATELGDRFRLLTRGDRTAPARQQTLRAAIDWSYELLFDEERRVFERLAVFAGGWSLEAARAVCSDDQITPNDVQQLLERLVDKSLVVTRFDGVTTRFDMLQTLLDYCRERFRTSNDAPRLLRRHKEYFLALCEECITAQRGEAQRAWLQAVNADTENIRTALSAAIEDGDAVAAQSATGALGWFWWFTGRATEGSRWMALASAVEGDAPPLVRGRLLAWSVYLTHANLGGRTLTNDAVDEIVDEAERCFRTAGELQELAETMSLIAVMYSTRGYQARARKLILDAEQQLLDLPSSARVVAMRTWVSARRALYEGRNADAEEGLSRAVRLLAELGDLALCALSVPYRARLALQRGDIEASVALLEDGLRLAQEVWLLGLADLIGADLGDALVVRGDIERARDLLIDARNAGRDLVYLPGYGRPQIALAALERRVGNYDAAESAAEEALELVLAADNREGIAQCLALLGYLAEARGDIATARARHQRALSYALETSNSRSLALAVEGLAGAAHADGNDAEAARFLGAADALRHTSWPTGWPVASAEGDAQRIAQLVRTEVGDAAYAKGFAAGASDADGVVDELRALV
jgi:predicted ATPase/DNA-binding SARP family transcriptional activator